MLNDTLTKILPSLVRLLIRRLIRSSIKDIGAAEMGAKELRYFRPSHKFGNGEEFEELGIERNLGVSGIFVDTVEEIGLFVVVWSEDYIVDDSLEDLAG